MKDKKKTVYYRFAEQVLKALKIAHVRRYPHKHDPKKYGIWVHVVLYLLFRIQKAFRYGLESIQQGYIKIRRRPASDQRDGLPLLRKAQKIKKMKSLDADKGYIGEPLRKFVVEKCKAEDRIKVKNKEVPIWRTKGEYLKKAKRKKLRANYRSLCETFHSVLKKVTGSTVRAIKVCMQNKEVAFKVFACSSLRRARTCLFAEVFY